MTSTDEPDQGRLPGIREGAGAAADERDQAGGAVAVFDEQHGHPSRAPAGHPDPRLTGEAPIEDAAPKLKLLVYSDDIDTRAAVRTAIGRRVATDLPPVEWTEVATAPALVGKADAGGIDVLILDGEAAPAGGLGMCKQLKDEIYRCPPILVLTGRPQDAWLATWSRADAAVPHPLDPGTLAEAVAGLARRGRRGA